MCYANALRKSEKYVRLRFRVCTFGLSCHYIVIMSFIQFLSGHWQKTALLVFTHVTLIFIGVCECFAFEGWFVL
jgi:hypothetical protein